MLDGELHVLDEDMRPVPIGTPGTLWFKTASPFEYFKDPVKTSEARSPDGTMTTVGDVGYVDADGYVYLTDRADLHDHLGGVNIYPQECENLLITHPSVADAAVFGVPNADLGEEVKAVVQAMPGIRPDAAFADELIAFCRQHLAHIKCPRSIDFAEGIAAGCRPASSTSACFATAIGASGRAASCNAPCNGRRCPSPQPCPACLWYSQIGRPPKSSRRLMRPTTARPRPLDGGGPGWG